MHSASDLDNYRMLSHERTATDTTLPPTMLPNAGEQQFLQFGAQVQQLCEGVAQLFLLQQEQHLSLVPKPEKYGGDPRKCRLFLLYCQLYFNAHKGMTDKTILTHFLNLLTDKALSWATVFWQGDNAFTSYGDNHVLNVPHIRATGGSHAIRPYM